MSEFYATSVPVPFTWSRATKLKLKKLTESCRFKETQKNLLSFTQRISWPKTNTQTKQKQDT